MRFGAYEFDIGNGELRKEGKLLRLQPQPSKLLTILLSQPGRLISREELRQQIWDGTTFVDFEQGLNFCIRQIRAALNDEAAKPRFVETIPRRGYRFIASLKTAPLATLPVSDLPEQSSLGRHSGRHFPRVLAWLAVSVLIILLAAARYYRSAYGSGELRSETIDSVAVLPFVNASGDPNAEYLSDGVTESLINSLSQLPNLRVMSSDSVFSYKGKQTDARTIGRELGVRAVFKVRVAPLGDSLFVTAELIDARDNSHIWGQQYRRKPADIFTLQNEIAREMTAALRVRLTGEDENRITKSYTANPDAYQDYLRGRYLFSNVITEEGLHKAIEYFRQAIAKDPSYALAFDGLADGYNALAFFGYVSPKEGYPSAKEAALKALEMDDTLAEAHTSLGWVKTNYDWDWSGGEKEFQRAIELNGRYARAHDWYAAILYEATGRFEESLTEQKRALELDPLALVPNRNLGWLFYFSRRYDEASEQGQKTLELNPNFTVTRILLGETYVQRGMYKEAWRNLKKR